MCEVCTQHPGGSCCDLLRCCLLQAPRPAPPAPVQGWAPRPWGRDLVIWRHSRPYPPQAGEAIALGSGAGRSHPSPAWPALGRPPARPRPQRVPRPSPRRRLRVRLLSVWTPNFLPRPAAGQRRTGGHRGPSPRGAWPGSGVQPWAGLDGPSGGKSRGNPWGGAPDGGHLWADYVHAITAVG